MSYRKTESGLVKLITTIFLTDKHKQIQTISTLASDLQVFLCKQVQQHVFSTLPTNNTFTSDHSADTN